MDHLDYKDKGGRPPLIQGGARKHQICVAIPPEVRSAIDGLVLKDEFPTIAAYVRQAILADLTRRAMKAKKAGAPSDEA